MKILSLRLRGFIGIRDGMGLEEIFIDFEGMNGLIAFSGPNGRGKTTVLENMQPYRQMVSRSGSLAHQCYLKDSFKTLAFEHNGHTYLSDIKINGVSGKMVSNLYVDGSEKSETTGKNKEYDRIIEELFGSANLFFSSVFCGQNSRKLNDLKPAELKALFSEFLALDAIAAHEGTAKDVLGFLKSERQTCLGTQERLLAKIDELRSVRTHRNADIADLKLVEGALSECDTRLNELKRKLEAAIEDQTRNTAQADKIKHLRAQILTAQDVRDADNKKSRDKIDTLTRTLHNVGAERLADKERLERAKRQDKEKALIAEEEARLDDRRKKNLELLSERDELDNEIGNADKTKAGIIESIYTTQADISRLMAETKSDIQNIGSQIKSLEHDIENAAKDTDLVRLNAKINALEESLADLDARDPDCASNTCSYIVRAIEAKNEIPKIRVERDSRLETLERYKVNWRNSIKLLNDEIHARTIARENQIKHLQAKVDANDERIITLNRRIMDKSFERDRVEERRAEIVRECADLEASIEMRQGAIVGESSEVLAERIKGHDENLSRIESSIMEWRKTIDETNEACKALEDTYNAEIYEIMEEMGDVHPSRYVEQARLEIKSVEETRARHEKEANKYRAAIIAADKHLEEDKGLRRAQDKEIACDNWLLQTISDWEVIATACGKDGIRALEIDATAPAISHHANQLLHRAFGPGYSVKFLTEHPETGKEILEIVAIREDGREDDISVLSGGQRVWVLKALRLGQTMISVEKLGSNVQTAFADEEDGALDDESAVNFTKMLQAFMDYGGFSDAYFITHKESVLQHADGVLEFGANGVREA